MALAASLLPIFAIANLAIVSAATPARAAEAAPAIADPAIERVLAKVFPALVRVDVVMVEGDGGRLNKRRSAGSGVVISAAGHVVTNHHVAGRARHLVCRMADGEEIEADLVGTDPLADIAVIKLDLAGRPAGAKPLAVATFGDSDAVRVGDRVFALGSPAAVSQSVTAGIVSNANMVMPEFFWPFTFKLDGEDVGELVRWIAHDAVIYGGNSGGPLVNAGGEIVGINEIGLGSLGGAVPGNLAKAVAKQLIATGRVERSWIGLEAQPLLKDGRERRGVLGAAVAIVPDATARSSLRPRLGAVSFLHHFGSALNRHVHLHACVTDGLFRSRHEGQAAELLPARPVTPADLLALTERVRTRLVRWFRRHGLLDAASSSPLPLGERRGEGVPDAARRSHDTSRIAWAKLMAKIAEDFPLACPACGGDIRLIAFITEPAPIRKILTHVGEPLEPPPLAPPRGLPTSWAELVQVHGDRDANQASPDDLPVIDIRSL